jgi:hypothetical protein
VRSWDVLQHALFAQHPGWHATGLDAFDRMHDTAGNRSVAAQSASPTATDTATLANITLFIAWSGQLVEFSVLLGDLLNDAQRHYGGEISQTSGKVTETFLLLAFTGLDYERYGSHAYRTE